MKRIFPGKKNQKAPLPAQQVEPAEQDEAGSSELSFMSMGEGGMSPDAAAGGDGVFSGSAPERPPVVPPLSGEAAASGGLSYSDEEDFSKAPGIPATLYRMEDNKERWDDGLDADVSAAAALLVQQMHVNPDDTSNVFKESKEDLSEFRDPLGMGVLNQATLQLEQPDGGGSTLRHLKKLQRYQAGATMKMTMTSPRTTREREAPRAHNATLFSKIQVTSPEFDPWLYLGTVHTETTRAQFTAGLNELDRVLAQRQGQLRQLVKENFQRFIGCKGTIDDISLRLRANEALSSTSGSTKAVAEASAEAEEAAQNVFAPILQRQEEANSVRQKLLLLQRFEPMFQMPNRVAKLAEQRDFESVVAEYAKGRKLIPVRDHALWREVSRRLEEEVTVVYDQLMMELQNPSSSVQTVVQSLKYVEMLKKEGLPRAQPARPLTTFASKQRQVLQKRLKYMVEKYVEAVNIVTTYKGDAADSRLGQETGDMSSGGGKDVTDFSSQCSVLQLAWIDLLQGLAGFFSTDLALLAQVIESEELEAAYNAQDQQKVWMSAMQDMKEVLQEVKGHIRQELDSTLVTLWGTRDRNLAAHFTVLVMLGEERAKLEDRGFRHGLDVITDVATGVLSHGVSVLESNLSGWGSGADDWETWRVDPSIMNSRQPVSPALSLVHNGATTAMLSFVKLKAMAWRHCKVALDDVHERMARAFLKRLNRIAQKLRTMLKEVQTKAKAMLQEHKKTGGLFTIDTRDTRVRQDRQFGASSPGLITEAESRQPYIEAMTAPMMALSLMSNTAYLIDHGVMYLTVPRLPLMHPGDKTAQDQTMKKVQLIVADLKTVRNEAQAMYVELQGSLLRASVKHYLSSDGTLWDSMPLRRELRDATYDMAYALVLILNQVQTHATPSVSPLMVSLCEITMGALLDLLKSEIKHMNAAALATLFLEMHFIEDIIPQGLKSAKFDDYLDQCYDLLLSNMLAIVKKKPPGPSSSLGKVLDTLNLQGGEQSQMESLHSCLEAYASKVLPSHANRASLHFDCFKYLGRESKSKARPPDRRSSGMFGNTGTSSRSGGGRRGAPDGAASAPVAVSMDAMVRSMTGKLSSIIVTDDD